MKRLYSREMYVGMHVAMPNVSAYPQAYETNETVTRDAHTCVTEYTVKTVPVEKTVANIFAIKNYQSFYPRLVVGRTDWFGDLITKFFTGGDISISVWLDGAASTLQPLIHFDADKLDFYIEVEDILDDVQLGCEAERYALNVEYDYFANDPSRFVTYEKPNPLFSEHKMPYTTRRTSSESGNIVTRTKIQTRIDFHTWADTVVTEVIQTKHIDGSFNIVTIETVDDDGITTMYSDDVRYMVYIVEGVPSLMDMSDLKTYEQLLEHYIYWCKHKFDLPRDFAKHIVEDAHDTGIFGHDMNELLDKLHYT